MEYTMEKLIFEKSRSGRRAFAQAPRETAATDIPDALRRTDKPGLPEASELQVVRHFTRLLQLNFSIDTQFYPLGSCTMKYNPRACNALALLPPFAGRHPLGPVSHGQGFMSCMHELQEMLIGVTGMTAVSLTPMAGAQGELSHKDHRCRGRGDKPGRDVSSTVFRSDPKKRHGRVTRSASRPNR